MTQRRQLINLPSLAAGLAIGALLVSGSAYAARSITSKDIKNNTIKSQDIKDGSITGQDIGTGTITSQHIQNGQVSGADLEDGGVTTADILDGTITANDLAPDSVGSAQVVDFGLSNEDIGVLFAQVNADGTLFHSSGGVRSLWLATGLYEVDFGRNVTNCAFIATQGEGSVGSAGGAIIGASDRAGNPNAVFVSTRDASNALINRAIQVLVVC